MTRHYKASIVFTDGSKKEAFIPIEDLAFFPSDEQAVMWLEMNYKNIKTAYIIQKSSKRRVQERVI